MSRDYARKTPPRRAAARPERSAHKPRKREPARMPSANSQAGGLSLRWIFSLAAVGAFIGFIVYLNSLPTGSSPARQATPATPPPKSQPVTPAVSEQKPQNFRFYEMLPDSEVIPPKVEEYTPGPSQQNFRYLVQTGSFRQQADAERQRAQIAFQGLRASVSRIDLNNGSIWYRVNVGPFDSRSQMNAAIDKLVAINIQPLARKIPKED